MAESCSQLSSKMSSTLTDNVATQLKSTFQPIFPGFSYGIFFVLYQE